MWQHANTPALGVVKAKAAFTLCQTVYIWHLLCFSEAELDHDQGSAAVQLSPFFYFLMWLVLNSKKRRNFQIKTRRHLWVQVHQTEWPDPTSICPYCVCLFHSPQLILFAHMIFTAFPSSICSTLISLLCHLILTLRHVGISIFCLQSQISLMIICILGNNLNHSM